MTTPLLGPIAKRLREADAERMAEWNRQEDEIMRLRDQVWEAECAEDNAYRVVRTATWLAAAGWLTVGVLAAALVL